MGVPPWSLDRDRVDGCADRTGDQQRCRGQPALIDAVGGALGGEAVEVPHLTDEQPDVRDGDLVQRLEGIVELVRADLESPGIGGDRRELRAVEPSRGGERQSG